MQNTALKPDESLSEIEKKTIALTRSLCLALQSIHAQQLSHQHLSHLTVKALPSNSVKLIHYFPPVPFDTCHEISSQAVPRAYEPDFLSPEQRAQNNRTIDHSSDFFSIGILMVFWLTGKTPLRSVGGDVLLQLPQETSSFVRAIIEKLLSLYPENRYLSLNGLIDDLKTSPPNKKLFFPGKTDKAETLQFSDMLFGRDTATQELQDQFKSIKNGNTKCILLSGEAGVGKTTLISSTFRSLCRQHGTFCYGKVDFITYAPYSSITNAFSDLISQHFSNDSEQDWETRLKVELGSNIGLLANFIPELKKITNSNFEEEDSDPLRLRNRLFYSCAQLISLLASKTNPIVFFIDDLQWMSPSELDLLCFLLESKIPYFLLIGAYRASECKSEHYLHSSLGNSADCLIKLNNLNIQDLQEWIRFIFKTSKAESLAKTLYNKTHGNPFFTKKLIESLCTSKIIEFNKKNRKWEWNDISLEQTSLADNIVHLILETFRDLPNSTQSLLLHAACLGNTFKLATLISTKQKPKAQLIHDITIALDLNFISKTDRLETYKFTHDRLLRNIYFEIAESKRSHIHWKIAKNEMTLFKNKTNTINEVEIASHIVESKKHIPPHERKETIDFLLHSAETAKINSDFKSALNFYEAARTLLPKDHWEKDHETSFNIYLKQADAAFYGGEYSKSEYLSKFLLTRTISKKQELNVYEQILRLNDYESNYTETIKASSKILEQCDISIHNFSFSLFRLKTIMKLFFYDYEHIISKQKKRTQNFTSELNILNYLISAYYRNDHKVMGLLIFKQIELLSKSKDTSVADVCVLLIAIYITHKTPFKNKGLQLANRVITHAKAKNNKLHLCHLLELYATFIQAWVEPFETCISTLELSKKIGLETGDSIYTQLSVGNIINLTMIKGHSLSKIEEKIEEAKKIHPVITTLRTKLIQIDETLIQTLRTGSTKEISSYKVKSRLINFQDNNFLAALETKKALAYFLLNKKGSLLCAYKAFSLIQYQTGFISYFENIFWSSYIIANKEPNKNISIKHLKNAIDALTYWVIEKEQKNLLPYYYILKSELSHQKAVNDESFAKLAFKNSTFQNNRIASHLALKSWRKILIAKENFKHAKSLEKKEKKYLKEWIYK